ncbi:hypothetical protein Ptr902_07722 [Pyrenophora tritici-repentis]|nr:hypothetical protein Ptr902_07722 [Pyrenophora tritici-repentis]
MNVEKDVAAVAVPEDPADMQETGSEYTTLSDGGQTGPEYSVKDNSDDKKKKDKKHTSTYSIKIGRAFTRLVLLTTCLSFIAIRLLYFNKQLSIAAGHNMELYNATTDMSHAHISEASVKSLFDTQLDTIDSLPLSRRFMEPHERCLVRSLYVANASLSSGPGFQYPNIRDRVTEWADEHCGRQVFSPLIVAKASTAKQRLEQHWANFAYRSRYLAERVPSFFREFKQEMFQAYVRYIIGDLHRHDVDVAKLKERIVADTTVPAKVLPDVPFGFAFVCEDGRPCRLTYPNGTDQATSEANSTSNITIALFNHLTTRQTKLFTIINDPKELPRITTTLINLIYRTQIALLILIMVLPTFADRTFLETFASNKSEVCILIAMLAFQCLIFIIAPGFCIKGPLLFRAALAAELVLLVGIMTYLYIDEMYEETQLVVEPLHIALGGEVGDIYAGTDADADAQTVGKKMIRRVAVYEISSKWSEEYEKQFVIDMYNRVHYGTETDTFTESESESEEEYMIDSDTVDLAGGLTTLEVREVEGGWAVL